jgi:hypothetical protein
MEKYKVMEQNGGLMDEHTKVMLRNITYPYQLLGMFVLGELEGEGTMTNSITGEKCQGNWKNNCLEGIAKRTYPNGDMYPLRSYETYSSQIV